MSHHIQQQGSLKIIFLCKTGGTRRWRRATVGDSAVAATGSVMFSCDEIFIGQA